VSRNKDGTFGEGNNFQKKKDFTKEMAKHITSQEMWYLSKLIADMPSSDLDKYTKDNSIGLSLLGSKIIDKIKAGDSGTIKWFVEMMIGRPSQQVIHEAPEIKSFKLSYERSK
jgi:hypothetical protein